ncbi:MAG: subtilisin/kexin-like serine protease HreP [Calditrichia bacterium]
MNEPYYYYSSRGEKIPLRRSKDTLAIAYKSSVPQKDFEKLIRGDDRLAQFIRSAELEKRNLILYKRSPAATQPLETFIERIFRSPQIAYVSSLFYRDKTPVVVSNEFIACFLPRVTRKEINKLNRRNKVKIVQELDFSPNTFILRVEKPISNAGLEMANRYYETGLTVYSEPNFIIIRQLKFAFMPNDPLFSRQWHLPRIQAPDAWDITRGDPSVIVAIVDDGVDLDHEDFASPGKIVPGQDFVSGDPDPRPGPGDHHGTAVAGVALADGNNGIGVTGIAPGCRLMPIRLVGVTSVALEAQAFRFAADNGAWIISNSWGPPDGGGVAPLPAVVQSAIDHATDNGRGGKGCIFFFAAGNGNESISLDGYASYDRVIAVAACNDKNIRSGYSDFGPEVDISAPSDGTSAQPALWSGFPPDTSTLAIFTTDRMGAAGYNPPASGSDPAGAATNYTGTFGGTSSACPLAAGLAALMLSVNADLTWQQIKYILEATADKIDDSNTDPVGQYQANGHSQWYGFGRVNALNAVKGARSSVAERDFVHSVRVTLRRTSGNRFVSTEIVHAIDARQRRANTATDLFIRSGPDGFLRAEMAGIVDEVEVDE